MNKIILKNLNYYYLHVPLEKYSKRKENITNILKDYKLFEVNPVINISRNRSCASGFLRIFDKAIQDQDREKPFEPFVILEDDIGIFSKIPNEITIPKDADLFYLGNSQTGINYYYDNRNPFEYKMLDDGLIKINNMSSMHAIMVCSFRGLSMLQKSIIEDYMHNEIQDQTIPRVQKYINVYGLQEPIFYQKRELGGAEYVTKFTFKHWEPVSDKKMYEHKWKDDQEDSTYILVNTNPRMTIDMKGGITDKREEVWSFIFNLNKSQEWELINEEKGLKIKQKYRDLYLDVENDNLVLRKATREDSQIWIIDSKSMIQNVSNKKYISYSKEKKYGNVGYHVKGVEYEPRDFILTDNEGLIFEIIIDSKTMTQMTSYIAEKN